MSTVPVAGDGVALLYAAITLLVLTWVTVSLRVCVRIWRKVLGMDDYLMVVGLVRMQRSWEKSAELMFEGHVFRNGLSMYRILLLWLRTVCQKPTTCYNLERHQGQPRLLARLPNKNTDEWKIFYVAEYFYAVSAAIIKCSIAVTLMRIAASQCRYNLSLYAIIGLTWVAAIVFCSGIASICKSIPCQSMAVADKFQGQPIETLWGEAEGTCNLQLNSNVSFFFSAIEILTDWSLAILPAVLLWNVQMKGSVKTSVAVILALASMLVPKRPRKPGTLLIPSVVQVAQQSYAFATLLSTPTPGNSCLVPVRSGSGR